MSQSDSTLHYTLPTYTREKLRAVREEELRMSLEKLAGDSTGQYRTHAHVAVPTLCGSGRRRRFSKDAGRFEGGRER